jgi:hypothetical protein
MHTEASEDVIVLDNDEQRDKMNVDYQKTEPDAMMIEVPVFDSFVGKEIVRSAAVDDSREFFDESMSFSFTCSKFKEGAVLFVFLVSLLLSAHFARLFVVSKKKRRGGNTQGIPAKEHQEATLLQEAKLKVTELELELQEVYRKQRLRQHRSPESQIEPIKETTKILRADDEEKIDLYSKIREVTKLLQEKEYVYLKTVQDLYTEKLSTLLNNEQLQAAESKQNELSQTLAGLQAQTKEQEVIIANLRNELADLRQQNIRTEATPKDSPHTQQRKELETKVDTKADKEDLNHCGEHGSNESKELACRAEVIEHGKEKLTKDLQHTKRQLDDLLAEEWQQKYADLSNQYAKLSSLFQSLKFEKEEIEKDLIESNTFKSNYWKKKLILCPSRTRNNLSK